MKIEKILENLSNYDEVQPSEKMIKLGDNLKNIFENILNELNLDYTIDISNRPCLKIDLENDNDYPVVSVSIDKDEEWLLLGHIYPKDYQTIDGDLIIQIESDYNDYIEKDFEESKLEELKIFVKDYLSKIKD